MTYGKSAAILGAIGFVVVSSLAMHEPSATPSALPAIDSTLLKAYRWRSLGPDRGGRSIAVSGVKGRKNEAYFGAVGGGLWKTMDGGTTWAPVTDGQIKSASVGAVAVSESNPDIVYIGMGESCIRGNIMAGDGVYKSTDAGKTWTHVGFASSENISKIRINPNNPDIVYVAAFGKHSAPNPDRGVYKSTDGGKTWKKVLYRDDKTAAIDISIDRNNPNVIYAAMWEAFRKEYTMSSGGPGSGLFKSTDGGETWTEITRGKGLPQAGVVGRIGVAVSGANSNRVYALVENDSGGLFKSDDAGASWTLVNTNRGIRQRAFYYTHVYADPKDQDVVYMQNTALFRSTDGGKTTRTLGGTHGDHHDLWIDPDDPTHIMDGNDGGGAVSTNTGGTWTDEDYPTAQWYHVITTKHIPYHVCGAQQDNSTLCTPSNLGLGGGGFGGGGGGGGRGGAGGGANRPPGAVAEQTSGFMAQSYQAAGGEPGYIATDPLDPDVYFSGTNNGGYLDKYNRRTGYRREVNPYPWFYSGEPSKDIPERWQWTYPIIFSKVNPRMLLTSSQRLWKTLDGGNTWTAISGDLTRHDPKTMGHSGGPITGDMNGPEVYAVIFSIGPSKKDVNVIWTGSDDGIVSVTKDGGKTWANVTPKDMPEFGRVTQIDASAFDAGVAYVSVRRPLLDDKSPYLWKTKDYGATWTKIVNGVRPDDWTHCIREDQNRRGLLYACGQHGVYISYDDGANWENFSLNLPDVPVSDLVVETNDLVISTHGRGFYVLDNVGPLRQYGADVTAAADAFLFKPNDLVRSTGALSIQYWLKKPAQRVALDILDSAGRVVRSYAPAAAPEGGRGGRGGAGGGDEEEGGGGFGRGGNFNPAPSTAAGLQRVQWDGRYAPATTFPGMILWGANTNGPAAPPGMYRARLNVDGKEFTRPITIRRNPLYTDVSDADLRAQFNLAIKIRDKVTEANDAVIQIRGIKREAMDRMAKNSDAALKTAGDKLNTNLADVEDDIYQVKNQSGQDPLNFPIKTNNRLANLNRIINTGDGRPNPNIAVLLDIYTKQLTDETTRLNAVITSDLAAFNNELKRLNLAVINAKCPGKDVCSVVP